MITYSNVIQDSILSPLEALLESEFGIPVSYEKHEGASSFMLVPESDSLIELLSVGQARQYTITIDYRSRIMENFTGHMTRRAERVKRLILNNTATSNWHGAVISEINYYQDEDDPQFRHANLTFTAVHTEVI